MNKFTVKERHQATLEAIKVFAKDTLKNQKIEMAVFELGLPRDIGRKLIFSTLASLYAQEYAIYMESLVEHIDNFLFENYQAMLSEMYCQVDWSCKVNQAVEILKGENNE